MSLAVATAFGAGFLASLSPCVYPMLPITLGYLTRQTTSENSSSRKKRMTVIAFFLGQVAMFTALGLAAVQIGEIFGFSSQSPTVNYVVGSFLLLFAVLSFFEKTQEVFAKINRYMPQGSPGKLNLFSAFFVGASSALVASPCTSPVLGGVLGTLAGAGSFSQGLIQMLAFSSGMSLIFLIAGLGLVNLKKLPRAGNWMRTIHHITIGLLAAGALYYFYQAWQMSGN